MGSALCHLLQVLQRGDAAFAAAENERTAVGSEPIGPVVAHEVLLRPNHILRIEGEMPSIAERGRSRSNREQSVRRSLLRVL